MEWEPLQVFAERRYYHRLNHPYKVQDIINIPMQMQTFRSAKHLLRFNPHFLEISVLSGSFKEFNLLVYSLLRLKIDKLILILLATATVHSIIRRS